ncbi:MAG: hypothetical protein ACFFF4_01610 [Candidatus Thorarchaeota archaeon]
MRTDSEESLAMEDKSMAFNLMPCHNDSSTLIDSCERIRASSLRLVVKAAEDDGKHNTYT